jgi:uncharacterized protein (TIGR02284 family)
MITSSISKAPPYILEKLNYLIQLLIEGKNEYESYASKLDDKNLQRTVLTLAQESKQYAMELCCQVEMLGGNIITQVSNNSTSSNGDCIHSEEILYSCAASEKKMIKAYRTVLNEPFLFGFLRQMMQYQLNGIMCAFLQLKLLTTSFHR